MSKLLIACIMLGLLCVTQVNAQTPVADCPVGWYWDRQKCEVCAENCQTCTLPGKCTACKDGYYKNNDLCVSCGITGVKECCTVGGDASAKRAISCIDGYYLDGSVCIKADENCETRIGTTMICQKCKDGFYVDSSNVCITGTVTGCKTYVNKNNCSVCNDGYFLEQLKDSNQYAFQGCTACNDNCICNTTNKCTGCQQKYYNSAAAGQPIVCEKCNVASSTDEKDPESCDKDGCMTAVAASCPSDTKCLTFSGQQNKCMGVANCAIVKTITTGIACEKCVTGYYLKDGKDCTKCPDSTNASTDYAKCTSDVVIQQCAQTKWAIPFTNQQYLVPDPTTTPANQLVCKENANNCRTMKDAGQDCTSCYDGYHNVNGKCVTCDIANCVTCSVTVTAAPNQKLQCEKCTQTDQKTNKNWYPKADKTACIEYPAQILTCTTNKDVADELRGCKCVSSYKIKKTTESTCEACSDANCIDCGTKDVDGTNTCSVCAPGYGVVDSKCVLCTLNCANCDKNKDVCQRCSSGYYLVDKYCSPKRDHCTSYDKEGCSVCEYNYYRNSQHCVKCTDQAVLATSGGTGAYERMTVADKCVKVDAATCQPVVTPPPTPGTSTASGSTTPDSNTSTGSGTVTPTASSTPQPNTQNSVAIIFSTLAILFAFII